MSQHSEQTGYDKTLKDIYISTKVIPWSSPQYLISFKRLVGIFLYCPGAIIMIHSSNVINNVRKVNIKFYSNNSSAIKQAIRVDMKPL